MAVGEEQRGTEDLMTDPARPLHVAHLLGGREGGGITTAIRALVRHLPKDITCSLVTLRPMPAAENIVPDDCLHLIRRAFTGDPRTVTLLERLCDRLEVDILHTHSISSNLYGRLLRRRRRDLSLVTTVHASTRAEVRGASRSPWKGRALAWIDFAMRGLTDHFIAVSDSLRDELIERGTGPDQVTAIPHGLDVGDLAASDAEIAAARKQFDLPPERPLIGIVGRLTWVKNHDLFLRAARRVVDAAPDTLFVIVGDGPLRNQLSQTVASLGLEGHVRFTGWIEHVAPLLQLLDIMVLASHSEGFGYAVIEGMATDCVPVVTRIGEMPRIIDDHRTGRIVPPGDEVAMADALLELIRNPQERTAMASAARRDVLERFSVDREVVGTRACYLDVIRRR
ncbi:Alpha-D-kanosaminyltransferase [Maioricimonas rarisocia]|uniref:Alpha-D-kanosaminyltransferase n=1 Tax=Maioricimonas rarisocia TaxID=2528026 RepID=A0A517ZD74_9PLAN|nr:glycosyltransferase [Maioricimonas rarisocia]QDU40415.1 Alpha-D-kanosaminyltransferase [Maioricimonas rarisocia]